MDEKDYPELWARIRRLWPQADQDPKVMGEWWPTLQRYQRKDAWEALDELAPALIHPPTLAEWVQQIQRVAAGRREAERDLVVEVVAVYPVWRGRLEQHSPEDVLRHCLDMVGVPLRDEDWVARRARMQLGLPALLVADDETRTRWKAIGAQMDRPEVREAFREALMEGLEPLDQLALCEAALLDAAPRPPKLEVVPNAPRNPALVWQDR